MELYQLQYFLQAAKCESLSQASVILNISQPALSKAIHKLEQELNTQLFERKGKRLQLNDKGLLLQKSAEAALRGLQNTANKIRGTTSNSSGKLNIGIFGQQISASRCIASFMEANPNVDVVIDSRRKSFTETVVEEFDLIFYPEIDTFANIQGIPYDVTHLSIGVSISHPLAFSTNPVDLRSFANDPFIFMNTAAGSYESMYRLCVDSGFEPRIRAVTSSGLVQNYFIKNNLGVGFITDDAHSFAEEGMIRLELLQRTSEQTLCIATRNETRLSPLAREFLAFTQDYFNLV